MRAIILMGKKIKYNQVPIANTKQSKDDFWDKVKKWTLFFALIGGGFEAGCVYTEYKKNLEYLRIENDMQDKHQSEMFELREKLLNIEQDLRDCERERKQNEKRREEISKGDK